MKTALWIIAALAIALAVLLVGIVFHASRGRSVDAPVASTNLAAANSALDPHELSLSTTTESNSRVDRVFPNGVASEDARAEIGVVEPPPPDDALDKNGAWVAECTLPEPQTAEQVRAVLPAVDPKARFERWVKGRVVGTEQWHHVSDAKSDERFDRVAVIVDLVDLDKPVTTADIDRNLAWARLASGHLGAGEPSLSMTAPEAVKKARSAIALKKDLPDSALDIGVVVEVAAGKLFPGKLVWDVMYSAGFTWGDGDYFHWVPGPLTDDSQGISMNTTTGTGYFLPESLLAVDGSADVGRLEMSFNIARTWQPMQVLDVMLHTAIYAARRLGGKAASSAEGEDLDAGAMREHVAKVVRTMTAAGVTPGSRLALQVF